MNPQKHFKLSSQAILLAAISAAYPVTGYCVAAGRVEFAIGDVESVMANGIRHPLAKGADINAGESISTAAGARAQIRFSDGGFVSLQPGTLFRVDEYNYQNKTDGKEKGFFSLLKGGFRAISGLIGHFNRNTYRVSTPAATLGIRGTGYNMALRDDGLFVNVGEGAISLNNNAGLLVVTAGNAAYVANFNTVPTLTTQLPLTPPKSLRDPDFTVADNRNSSGNLTILPTALLSGSNYTLAYAYTGYVSAGGPLGGVVGLPAPVTATFNSTSQLTQYSASGDAGSLGAGTVSFSATDGIIGWGRWTGTITSAGGPLANYTSVTAFDYVVGIPTAVMPTTGSATYSLMGYTKPTATDLSTGYTVNGTLSANFGLSTVGVNMTIANASNGTYTISTATPLTIVGANFAGTNIGTTNLNASSCLSGCTTSIHGFFAGANAVRAGLSYSINESTGINNIQGVAAFTK
ncbi:MAG: FecR family protein [Gallionella sp.]